MITVYIVATTNNDGQSDYFQDIVLITESKVKAQRLTARLLRGRKKAQGIQSPPQHGTE